MLNTGVAMSHHGRTMSPMSLRPIISYGGGIQSTALLVLAARQQIDAGYAVFANVGDRSEHPETLDYVRNIAIPYGEAHGIEVVELRNKVDLYDHVLSDTNRSIAIPLRMAGGGFGNRKCTERWKITRVNAWLRKHGATVDNPATVHIGISLDEWQRVNNRRPSANQVTSYPLIDMRIDRVQCANIIRDAGLPVPPKSSCWFCPFTNPTHWAERRRDQPELFAAAVEFEDAINEKRARIGKDAGTLAGVPLRDVSEAQASLFDGCDSGYCWT